MDEKAKRGLEGAQFIANAVLFVFFLALFLQVMRWLLIRREFSKVGLQEHRDMKLAYFGGVVALVENVPQAALSAQFAALNGWTSWTTLNVAASLFLMAWKLVTPLLLRYKLL